MRLVFLGTVNFSQEIFKELLRTSVEVVGLITGNDYGYNSDYADLRNIARTHNVEILVAQDVNSSETIDWLKKKAPDVVVCAGWSKLIKREFLKIPTLGVVGYHPSSLPCNRGRHPLIWALALGLQETSSTFFLMDEGVDSGDILSQRSIAISNIDTATTLYRKMIDVAKSQIVDLMEQFENDDIKKVKQDEKKANTWRKRNLKDGEIDWRMSSQSIYNLIRALTKPYVGAHFVYKNKKFLVWEAEVIARSVPLNFEPGKILSGGNKNYLDIKCGEGAIRLLKVEPDFIIDKGGYL